MCILQTQSVTFFFFFFFYFDYTNELESGNTYDKA